MKKNNDNIDEKENLKNKIQDEASKKREVELSPLIDRSIFFGNPQIISGKLSPDGQWLSFLKEYNGIMNIWIKKLDEPFEKARHLTENERPLYDYFWTYDSRYILFIKDDGGDENLNIFSVDPFEITDNKKDFNRNLTPLKDVKAEIYKVSKNNPDVMMIGLNDRDKAWHDLYQLNIKNGKLTELYRNIDRITGYVFDWDDELKILFRTDEKGNTSFLRMDEGGVLTEIYNITVTENAGIIGWNEDNSKIYLSSNKGEVDLETLYIMDIHSLEINKIESDPENKVDLGGVLFDKNTRKLIVTSYTSDKTNYYWKDKVWEDNYNFLQSQFPDQEINITSYDKSYTKFLVNIGGDKFSTKTFLLDSINKIITHQYTARPELEKIERYLSPMLPISYKSSDNLKIPAYLTLPIGKEKKNLPLIVYVHGGPKGPRDYWGYNSVVQFLSNRGYAVLQPNYRASGGYGKAYLNAGDMEWGKLMQDDISFGVKYLIEQGICDKNKVAIMGGSYGGYATLAGLAFTPELYTCGVDIVGPSNIFTLLESIPPYWEAGRAFLYNMVGDPETKEGKARIEEASPLFSVDKIESPLLIIQGANDPRVKQSESDQIVKALYKKGKQVSYLLAEDEGHGFAKPINRMAMYAEIEKFLSEIMGGRYQLESEKDVKKRLDELKVDVSKLN